jgi:hypothetical protein
MLTFVHLSDIHFAPGDDGSQFDLNQHIRRALLADLHANPAGVTSYTGLLITGDIAYHGVLDEYTTAKGFLEDVYGATGLSMAQTYVVPGNHDVDRTRVQPTFPLWASHEDIRREANPVHWRATLQTQLQKDPSKLLLSPFHAYNDFAQGCECQTTSEALAWTLDISTPMELGYKVRLHGLNSALISDAADAPGKLLVSEFQTSHLRDSAGFVNVVMSHHPPDWLMDKAAVRQVLRRFAPVALFGHEHSVRLLHHDKQVQLFAGALQPERDTPDWLPTYHILLLGIDGTAEKPVLRVVVHTREFHNYNFRAWRNEDGEEVLECCLPLPREVMLPALATPTTEGAKSMAEIQTSESGTGGETSRDPQRELLVQFFRLKTPSRYEAAFKADLLRDGDDALDPQVMWAEVFRRAASENKHAEFWDAVAAHYPEMATHNPFRK